MRPSPFSAVILPVTIPSASRSMSATVFDSNVRELPLIHRGKVRDIYAVDDDHMLIVTTDRLSAFDVVLPDPIPDKGRVLTQISNFWFGRTTHVVPNQLVQWPIADIVRDPATLELLRDRSVVVRRLSRCLWRPWCAAT